MTTPESKRKPPSPPVYSLTVYTSGGKSHAMRIPRGLQKELQEHHRASEAGETTELLVLSFSFDKTSNMAPVIGGES